MCGICGIVKYNNGPVDVGLLKKMTQLLYHRGPDAEGYYISSGNSGEDINVGLGMRRLSIIDLETGDQPIYNEDKSVCIVLNGEIYNFKDLKNKLEENHRFKTKTDTEVIIHLYEEYGYGCLEYLRGMYSFALWDENKKILFIARDRMGQKPLYYSWINGEFCFSSELKALLEVPGFKKDINLSAINHYLTYQFIPAPMTIWKDVYALMPASSIIVNKEKRLIENRYWDIDFTKKTELSYVDAKDKLREIMAESVKLRMISDVPLGLFLSGGHDSTIIAGLMSEISSKPVKTFSMGFKEAEFSELKYAKTVADRYKTDHYEFIVDPEYIELLPKIAWHYDQPYADCSALPSYYLANETRKYVKVALNGDGGDESFAGYLKFKALKVAGYINPFVSFIPDALIKCLLKKIPMNESLNARKSFRYIHRFFEPIKKSPAYKNIIWRAYFSESMKHSVYSKMMKEVSGKEIAYRYLIDIFENAPADNDIDSMLYSDFRSYLPDDLLVKMDVASMANSLETRSPFLDHKLIEFTSSLPYKWKIRGLNSKFMLKDTFKEYLPDEILRRGKQGFSIPLGKWFRGELKGYLKDTVLSEKAINRGYFDRNNLEKFVNDHIEGRKDYGFCLWALVMLELWHREYFD